MRIQESCKIMIDKEAMEELREKLAELCHIQWSGWQNYMFSKGTYNKDGTWTMPKWAVERWQRQMNIPYSELSEEEKDSDRQEADRFLAVLIEKPKLKTIRDQVKAAMAETEHPTRPQLLAWLKKLLYLVEDTTQELTTKSKEKNHVC